MGTTTAAAATVNHWIGGQHVAAESGRTGAVHNPATGEVIAEVGFATVEDVDRAVATAKAAFVEWRATPLSRRVSWRIFDRSRAHTLESLRQTHSSSMAAAQVRKSLRRSREILDRLAIEP